MEKGKKGNNISRRDFIRATGLTCAALVMSGSLPFFKKQAFAEKGASAKPAVAAAEGENIKDVLKRFFGDRKIEDSHVELKTPIIAENGAVVPIRVSSDLPMEPDNYVKSIYIFVEGNIKPYTARVDLSPANGKAEIKLRIKMRKTSNVRAVVETSKGKLYGAVNPVKVTIGGCGG